MECPKCNNQLVELANFDNLLRDDLYCPHCNTHLNLNYDETIDRSTEWWWFVLYEN